MRTLGQTLLAGELMASLNYSGYVGTFGGIRLLPTKCHRPVCLPLPIKSTATWVLWDSNLASKASAP